jgi:hypothetical protein
VKALPPVTAEDVRRAFREGWNAGRRHDWVEPPEIFVDRIAERIVAYRAHLQAVRAAGDYVKTGQDAATNLADVLPHWIALATNPADAAVLAKLRDALAGAGGVIGKGGSGRPGEMWMAYAPELMGYINGALGEHRQLARCARIFRNLCDYIFGPAFDVSPESIERAVREWQKEEPNWGPRHFRIAGE